MMFCVVETIEDGAKLVTAVPKSWVHDGSTLLWPPTRKECVLGRKNCMEPLPQWQRMSCKIIFDDIGEYFLIFFVTKQIIDFQVDLDLREQFLKS